VLPARRSCVSSQTNRIPGSLSASYLPNSLFWSRKAINIARACDRSLASGRPRTLGRAFRAIIPWIIPKLDRFADARRESASLKRSRLKSGNSPGAPRIRAKARKSAGAAHVHPTPRAIIAIIGPNDRPIIPLVYDRVCSRSCPRN